MDKDFLSGDFVGDSGSINLDLLARQVVEGFITGLHKSPFHGFSVEFAEHRLYNSGDSVKDIDWKLYGRTNKMFVKRFEEETNLRCQLVLDISSSMYYPRENFNKLIFSACSAASLIHLLKKQRDAFGLTCFDEKMTFTSPARSTVAHQKFLFGQLENVMKQDGRQAGTALSQTLHELSEILHKRSMVIIFTDALESADQAGGAPALFSALQHLRHNKHEVVLFNVLDHRHEIQFDFENRPYQFIDMETGQTLKVQPSQIKDQYIKAMEAFRHELQLRCAQYHIDLVDADIASGFSQILQAYLIKRSRMKG
ncbi:DUF58 domain-containing protein [Arcticibacter sp. MXS-1]|uniref:DUF58 domain-containing protein n=1 Tax=Arcticibacter sp. MXS-1 TaxID=3341726 RepID=UPI0035A8E18D